MTEHLTIDGLRIAYEVTGHAPLDSHGARSRR